MFFVYNANESIIQYINTVKAISEQNGNKCIESTDDKREHMMCKILSTVVINTEPLQQEINERDLEYILVWILDNINLLHFLHEHCLLQDVVRVLGDYRVAIMEKFYFH